jgi:hypothetical protein
MIGLNTAIREARRLASEVAAECVRSAVASVPAKSAQFLLTAKPAIVRCVPGVELDQVARHADPPVPPVRESDRACAVGV